MAIIDDVVQVLASAGVRLKSDLWHPEDVEFLRARAKDLMDLEAEAIQATSSTAKAAYFASARDTIVSVRMLAQMRLETAEQHILDTLGTLFVTVVVPAVTAILPGLSGLTGLFSAAARTLDDKFDAGGDA